MLKLRRPSEKYYIGTWDFNIVSLEKFSATQSLLVLRIHFDQLCEEVDSVYRENFVLEDGGVREVE